jgi:hypothetical protein
VATGGEEAVLGRYGGVIGGDGSCCVYPVNILEVQRPLRGRILCVEVDSVVEQAWVKKIAGISWGFHISHRDLTAASGWREMRV